MKLKNCKYSTVEQPVWYNIVYTCHSCTVNWPCLVLDGILLCSTTPNVCYFIAAEIFLLKLKEGGGGGDGTLLLFNPLWNRSVLIINSHLEYDISDCAWKVFQKFEVLMFVMTSDLIILMFYEMGIAKRPVTKFIVPDWGGDKVDSGIGLSYRSARLHRLAGRYDNYMPESTTSPI
jgi:hypothetical protein